MAKNSCSKKKSTMASADFLASEVARSYMIDWQKSTQPNAYPNRSQDYR
jgi:hypothetical protein